MEEVLNTLPCKVLRKIARKATISYNKVFKNSDAMPCNFEDVIDKITTAKYFSNLGISKEIILASILYVNYAVYTGYVYDLMEILFYDTYEDTQIKQINILQKEISIFQTLKRNGSQFLKIKNTT